MDRWNDGVFEMSYFLPGEECAKESCGFEHPHPPHPYSTWSMYRLIEMLKSNLHCRDDEQLLEVLATMPDVLSQVFGDAAPESDQSRSEPVEQNEDHKLRLLKDFRIPHVEIPELRFTSGARIEPGMHLTIDRRTGHIVPLDRTYPGRDA